MPFLSHGILGMNARNLLYIKPFNPKKAIEFADDKLKTKAFLSTRNIPVAKLYARIEDRTQLQAFDLQSLPDHCVLKPNQGYGGEGIIVFRGRDGRGNLLRNGKTPMTHDEIIEHVEDILDGRYSLRGRFDAAFFEQLLIPHKCFARFRPVGLPDIRVIVFNLVPVMAMIRIPTAASEGKANLHMGGIGIGIDIAKGTTTHAAQYHKIIRELPHGGSPSGFRIPYWDEILLISSRIQQLTNIGYLAVDITIDEQMGPAVLEVNARAGLTVQLANLAPLRSRLERVQGIKVGTSEKGVRIGQDLFGERMQVGRKKEVEKMTLGTREYALIGTGAATEEIPCLIVPEQERTTVDTSVMSRLIETGAAEVENEAERLYRIRFTLGGRKVQTVAGTDDLSEREERMLVGRRDLQDFLIDPSRKEARRGTGIRGDLRAMDSLLADLDRELLLLKNIKPLNLQEERTRAMEDVTYNPVFTYGDISDMLDAAGHKLQDPLKDDSPLGTLLEKKRDELLTRIILLRARGNNAAFTEASALLFALPDAALIREARERWQAGKNWPKDQGKMYPARDVAKRFEETLARYSLHNWLVSVRERLVANCTVGNGIIYLRAGATYSESHVRALIAHEIETHALTAENATYQPVNLLSVGCAGYLSTQEGLAVYNQNQALAAENPRRLNVARNLLGLLFALEHSFADTRLYLQEELGYGPEKSLTQTIAMKRGMANTREPGAFTKSVAYFRGLRMMENFVQSGGDLKRLYIGKVALEDLTLIEQIPDLQPPMILPEFLR